MSRTFRGPLVCGLLAILMLSLTAAVATAAPVRLVRDAGPGTARFWRVHDQSWAYQHAFGLEPGEHPEWALHDGNGNPVTVGTRVAADFGNANFRAWWIARAQASLALGYRGLWIDDVAMTRVVNALDPRTGFTFTESNWQKNMADFMVAVRAALPGAEIVHDVIWTKGDTNADVLRELRAADGVSLEKGFNDPAVSSGGGTSGWQTLAGWVEREQARGFVVLDSVASTDADAMYGLASYLLVDKGSLALANDPLTGLGTFWSAGYDLDLGAPAGSRYAPMTGVWRRDFAGGIVLVNEPYRGTRTVSLPAGYMDLGGVARTSVTLAGGTGAILVPAPASTPAPTPPPAPVTVAPPPATVEPPVETTTPNRPSGSLTARISTVGHTAGARGPGPTETLVRGTRTRLSGTVAGAVSGSVRLVVWKRRGGKWSSVRHASAPVRKSGKFAVKIPALRSGRYRVRGSFLGTGTAHPSQSAYRTFHA